MTLNHYEKCLGVIGQGASELQRGDLASAEQLFGVALALTQSMLPDLARDLLPLTLYNLSLLRLRQRRADESLQLREQAMTCLETTRAASA